MERNKTVEEFIGQHDQWRDLLTGLRTIMKSTELEETIKWGIPVYTLQGKNVIGLAAFKQHAAIWFHQGALLKDESSKLVNAQEGKTHAQRQWRFEAGDTVDTAMVLAYVEEAIENQKQGRMVKAPPAKPLSLPSELKAALAADKKLKARFDALAPNKQKEYIEFIATAKQPETRARRLEKSAPLILDGKGLNDRYR